MIDLSMIRKKITLGDFLPIFVSSAFVLVFGRFYVDIYTTVKVKMLKLFFIIFMLFTTYYLYIMGSLMHIGEFTVKALIAAVIGLFYFHTQSIYMQNQVHKRMSLENIY